VTSDVNSGHQTFHAAMIGTIFKSLNDCCNLTQIVNYFDKMSDKFTEYQYIKTVLFFIIIKYYIVIKLASCLLKFWIDACGY
jgi:hypothetical protein